MNLTRRDGGVSYEEKWRCYVEMMKGRSMGLLCTAEIIGKNKKVVCTHVFRESDPSTACEKDHQEYSFFFFHFFLIFSSF